MNEQNHVNINKQLTEITILKCQYKVLNSIYHVEQKQHDATLLKKPLCYFYYWDRKEWGKIRHQLDLWRDAILTKHPGGTHTCGESWTRHQDELDDLIVWPENISEIEKENMEACERMFIRAERMAYDDLGLPVPEELQERDE